MTNEDAVKILWSILEKGGLSIIENKAINIAIEAIEEDILQEDDLK